ncbi:MAG: glycoside hydrolase family 99-like domain-containing protein [Kiritimatiellales bacterium]|nr:glycoside hydrolase family 99-like domain-containing protein [Kiritimatiellales bacterium]
MKKYLLLQAVLLLFVFSVRAEEKPLVGAIRWDAWYGDGSDTVNSAVEATLSVQRWQWRAPFFAEVVSTNQIRIRGGAADIQKEIDLAADAGLDYWAFCIYEKSDNLSRALNLYLDAPNRDRIKFCMNLQAGHFGMGGLAKALQRVPLYVEYMQRPEYEMVLDGRPLIYLLFPQNFTEPHALKNEKEAVQLIQALRDQAQAAGLKNPYIVFQDFSAKDVNGYRERLGGDAIGAYAANTGWLDCTYERYQNYVEGTFWKSFMDTGSEFVPLASTGFDMRPRIETGVPWDANAKNLDIRMYHEQPTPAEFAAHLQHSLQYLKDHAASTPANTVLIYAWNEFDEGGWLCPTLGEGTARLDAVKSVLKKGEEN